MEPKDPSRESSPDDSLQPNSSADEFFSKMNRDFRRPKPSEEAVAAALQAIQALTGDAALEASTENEAESSSPGPGVASKCSKCGGVNSGSNRFCGFCGATIERPASSEKIAATSAEQHVHHHHYHHHYFPGNPGLDLASPQISSDPSGPSVFAAGEGANDAETDSALRKLVEEWTIACNAKRADDLAALYSRDALLIRPGAPLMRGRASVKQLLQSELDSGLGDVQLDCTEIGVISDIGCVAGVSRMLAPVAPANRHERIGKFFLLVRREGGEWKILADIWCLDAARETGPAPKLRK